MEFICNLLLDYQIVSDLPLWENILLKLVDTKKYRLLLTVFEKVMDVSDFFAISSLPHTWNRTILGCVETEIISESGIDGDLSDRLVMLLQQCPLLSALDLAPLFKFYEDILEREPAIALKGLVAILPLCVDQTAALDRLTDIIADFGKKQVSLVLETLESQYSALALYDGFEVG